MIRREIKLRGMRWVGHVARLGDRRCACRILVRKPEGRRPLGRPRRRLIGICVADSTILHFVAPDSEGYGSNYYYYPPN